MPTPSHRAPKAPSGRRRRLPVLVGSMVVLALAAPVVASVMEPEVTTARDPQPQSAVDRATEAAAAEVSGRMTAAASPDRVLRLERAQVVAAREAREARERREARQARLRALAEKRAEERAREREEARRERMRTAPVTFRIGSFNVLGSQHTAPGGTRQKYPPASTRTAAAAGIVGKHGVDILGTQESFQFGISHRRLRTCRLG